MRETKTICAYCGVGCGIIVKEAQDGTFQVRGDPDHPANFGRLCQKGATLGQTLGARSRQLQAMIRSESQRSSHQDGAFVSTDNAINYVASSLATILERHGPSAIAFYGSGQLLTEDYYLANKWMKGYIGSSNIDTNSRLCMASAVTAHKMAFGQDTVGACYEDLDEADLFVFVGSNAAACHPVIEQRIRARMEKHPATRAVVIDPRRTATVRDGDLHLAIDPDTDIPLFLGLLRAIALNHHIDKNYINQHTSGFAEALDMARNMTIPRVAAICGISKKSVAEFYQLFISTEKTLTLYSQGVNQSVHGTQKVLSLINCHLATGRMGRPGTGVFSLTGQGNAMGGREVGGLANQLASHLDLGDPRHRQALQAFWQSPHMVSGPGTKAVDMFEGMRRGQIKAVWIMATNPAVSMPHGQWIAEALRACPLVIVSDSHGPTDTSDYAHVFLPSAGWGEKDGMVTNSERRISRQRAFMEPRPGTLRDWQWIAGVAQAMGYSGFDFSTPREIFLEYAALSQITADFGGDFDISGLAGLSETAYEDFTPKQWPINLDRKEGTSRLLGNGRFFHPDGRGRFVPTPFKLAARRSSPFGRSKPLTLNTGRDPDQWHTMTRTSLSPSLNRHHTGPYLEVHPDDARVFLSPRPASGLAWVVTDQGTFIAQIRETPSQKKRQVFAPFHWTRKLSSSLCLNQLTQNTHDPQSGQPGFKKTPCQISGYYPDVYGFYLAKSMPEELPFDYWVKTFKGGYFRIDFAVDDWDRALKDVPSLFPDPSQGCQVMEAKGKDFFRLVHYTKSGIQSCLFVSNQGSVPKGRLAESFMAEAQEVPYSQRQAIAFEGFHQGL